MYFTREEQIAPPEQIQTSRSSGVQTSTTEEATNEYDSPVISSVLSGAPRDSRRNGGTPILRSASFSSRLNKGVRVIALSRAQRTHGNRFTQQLVSQIQLSSNGGRVIQRDCACGGTCAKCTEPAPLNIPPLTDESNLIQRQTLGSPQATTAAGYIGGEVVPRDSFGEPLEEPTKRLMEERFGADFADVRVHRDERAAASAETLEANAYTVGRDIYFAAGKYAPETEGGQRLLAHELTHTLQQSSGEVLEASPAYQTASELAIGHPSDPLEHEAERVAEEVVDGSSQPNVSVAGPKRIRRDLKGTAAAVGGAIGSAAEWGWNQTGGRAIAVAGEVWDAAKETAAAFIDRMAPGVLPLLRDAGSFIYDKVTAGVDSVFNGVASRVQKQGVVGAIVGIISDIHGAIGKTIGQLAAGTCNSIVEAASAIGKFVKGIASETFAELGKIAKTVGDFFSGIWKDFGAPALEAIQKVAGETWKWIKEKAAWVWEKLLPIRKVAGAAWDWLKKQFNIARDEANGLLDRFYDWAKEQWMKIRDKIEPILGPLKIIAGVLLLLSPLGPIIAIWKGAPYLWQALQWIWANGIKPVTEEIRKQFREQILPHILSGIDAITAKLDEASEFLCGHAGKISSGLQSLEDALSGIPFLSLATKAVRVVRGFFDNLAAKGKCKFSDVIAEVKAVLQRVYQFVKPILELLRQAALIATLGPWAILDDGVWSTLNQMIAFAKKVPCIREIAGLLRVDAVMAKVGEIRAILKDIWEVVSNQEKFEAAIHQFLDGALAKIPGQVETVLGTIMGLDGPHLDALLKRFIAPKLAEVISKAPQLLIDMAWGLLWPWPGVLKEVDEIEKQVDKLKQSLWDFQFSKAVDAGLAIWRGVNGIAGQLYGWFFLAAVIIGAVFASPQAGAAVAYEVGEVLLVSTLIAEALSIEKSKMNLMSRERLAKPENERKQEDDEDYETISGSVINLAVIGALAFLSEIAVDFAKAVFAEIKGIFLPEAVEGPKVEVPARGAEPRPTEPVSTGGPKPAEPVPTPEARPTEPTPVTEPKPPEPVRPPEPRPSEPKPGEPRPGEPRPGEPRPGEPRPGEPKPGEPRPAEPKPEEPRPGEPRPEEPRPGEPKPEEQKPGEPRPEEPKPEDAQQKANDPVNDKPAEDPEPKPGEKDVDPAICFAAGTPVSTVDGLLPIETIVTGTLVYAYDIARREIVTQRVLNVTRGLTSCWVEIKIEQSVLRATRNHPIWIESEQRWIAAEQVKPGMTTMTQAGKPLEVSQVQLIPLDVQEDTYNLTIEEFPNFFAGAVPVLVHNITPSRIAHFNRPGYSNYFLRAGGPNGPIYYVGMFGPNESPTSVKYRHSKNHNRFDPETDFFELQPETRTYGEARLREQRQAVENETINKNAGEDYRCNRQDPMAADKIPEYEAYEKFKQGCG